MRSGRLRERITIQKQSILKDDVGQVINQWIDVCSVRAEIREMTGKEFQASQAEQSLTDCKILIRYRSDITSDMRVEHNGVYYDIKAVLADIKKKQLELPCQKGVRYENGS